MQFAIIIAARNKQQLRWSLLPGARVAYRLRLLSATQPHLCHHVTAYAMTLRNFQRKAWLINVDPRGMKQLSRLLVQAAPDFIALARSSTAREIVADW